MSFVTCEIEMKGNNMQIQNNTPNANPNFGMAFRKPVDIDKYAKYITEHESPRRAVAASNDFIRSHLTDTHFDMEMCSDNSIKIVAKTTEGRKFLDKTGGEKKFPKNGNYSFSKLEEKQLEIEERRDALEKAGASKFKMFFFNINSSIEMFIQKFRSKELSPKDLLPANMREADKFVNDSEKIINNEITLRDSLNELFGS